MKYRPDIDGLRTLAVLPVIAFHLGVPRFTGGFVGVDVFFVISGFLITSLIAPEIEGHHFSLARFYERRIRRIFPALFTVVAASIPIAVYLLLPADQKQFFQSVAATTLFSSNLLFWHQAGYFDGAAHTKPLLHTWSLAVEEQFYIFFPLMLVAIVRFARHRTRLLLCLIFVCSLAAGSWEAFHNPNSAFFLPHLRAWELLAGCILALTPMPHLGARIAEVLTVIGAALILYSVFSFSSATTFPGLMASLPVLGATLIIAAGDQSAIVGNLLRARPTVYLGRLSYSLYLWHWPLIVFSTYYLVRTLTGWEMVAVAAATLLLSQLSYQWIEQPARRRKWSQRQIFAVAGAAMVLLAGMGVAGHLAKGFPARLPSDLNLPGEAAYNVGNCLVTANDENAWNEHSCTFAGTAIPQQKIFLWGDSFAAHYLPGLRSLQNEVPFSATLAWFAGGEGACPPLLQSVVTTPLHSGCVKFQRRILSTILRERPALVILGARWDLIKDQNGISADIQPILAALQTANIPTILVGQGPVYPFIVPQKIWMERRFGVQKTVAVPMNSFKIDGTLSRLARKYNAGFFSPHEILCKANKCRYFDNGPLIWDYGHYSQKGSEIMVRIMRPSIEAILKNNEH
jgi:peptidoglycan/LPS O-acetylase OafA/YrhL